MKALAVDTSSQCISLAVKNGSIYASLALESGRKQSEKLLPAVQAVFFQAGLKPEELDFTVLCKGPGSFTGLRLGFAVVKALQLTCSCPVYGIPTLTAYAHPFYQWPGAVVSVIDAKKNRFYASVFRGGTETAGPADITAEELAACIDPEEKILAVGPDAEFFAETLSAVRPQQDIRCFARIKTDAAQQLLLLGEQAFSAGEPALKEYEGPFYLRKSEAEEKSESERHT